MYKFSDRRKQDQYQATGALTVNVLPQLSVTTGGVGAVALARQATVEAPACRHDNSWCTDGISIDPSLCCVITQCIGECISLRTGANRISTSNRRTYG